MPPSHENSAKLVTVASFRDLPEALLAKGALEAAGIECWLADDNIVRLDWFLSNLVGQVKINVREQDLGAAHEALRTEHDRPQLVTRHPGAAAASAAFADACADDDNADADADADNNPAIAEAGHHATEKEEDDAAERQCPKCGSLSISFGPHDSGMKLAFLALFSLPLPTWKQPHWRCARCGARWVIERDQESGGREGPHAESEQKPNES